MIERIKPYLIGFGFVISALAAVVLLGIGAASVALLAKELLH